MLRFTRAPATGDDDYERGDSAVAQILDHLVSARATSSLHDP